MENKKSYALYQMVTLLMTSSECDPNYADHQTNPTGIWCRVTYLNFEAPNQTLHRNVPP